MDQVVVVVVVGYRARACVYVCIRLFVYVCLHSVARKRKTIFIFESHRELCPRFVARATASEGTAAVAVTAVVAMVVAVVTTVVAVATVLAGRPSRNGGGGDGSGGGGAAVG